MERELEALAESGLTMKLTFRGWNGGGERRTVDIEEVAQWSLDRITELEDRVKELESDIAAIEAEKEVA